MSPSVNSSPSSDRLGSIVSMNSAASILSVAVNFSQHPRFLRFRCRSSALPNERGHFALRHWRHSQTALAPLIGYGRRKIGRCRPIRALAWAWPDSTSMSRGASLICIWPAPRSKPRPGRSEWMETANEYLIAVRWICKYYRRVSLLLKLHHLYLHLHTLRAKRVALFATAFTFRYIMFIPDKFVLLCYQTDIFYLQSFVRLGKVMKQLHPILSMLCPACIYFLNLMTANHKPYCQFDNIQCKQ